jgi:hypothetical protein
MPQGTEVHHAHAYLRNDGILIRTNTRLTTRLTLVSFKKDEFSTDAFEDGVDTPEAQEAVSEVMSERCPCVRRADLEQFCIHVLLPLAAEDGEKERIWQDQLHYFASRGYEVFAVDQRQALKPAQAVAS